MSYLGASQTIGVDQRTLIRNAFGAPIAVAPPILTRPVPPPVLTLPPVVTPRPTIPGTKPPILSPFTPTEAVKPIVSLLPLPKPAGGGGKPGTPLFTGSIPTEGVTEAGFPWYILLILAGLAYTAIQSPSPRKSPRRKR